MSAYNPENIFARILRGEIPCKQVMETPHTLAFHDISPVAPVHILVIPRGAYTDIHDFTSHASTEDILDFWKTVNAVATKMNVVQTGFRLIANTGKDSGQEVPHFHVHLLGNAQLRPLFPQTTSDL